MIASVSSTILVNNGDLVFALSALVVIPLPFSPPPASASLKFLRPLVNIGCAKLASLLDHIVTHCCFAGVLLLRDGEKEKF